MGIIDFFTKSQSLIKKPFHEECEDVVYHFTLSKMKFYCTCDTDFKNTDMYYIPRDLWIKIESYVSQTNAMLNDAIAKYPQIPHAEYDVSKLEFQQHNKDYNDFSMFFHHPLDYHGKDNIYPYSLSLRFGNNSNNHIRILFYRNGTIAREDMILWYRNRCYTFTATNEDGAFEITSAYTSNMGEKIRIFDMGYEKYQQRKDEYEWICKHLPALAPKSIGGYTKMKHSQSKTYLKIKSAATECGMQLNDNI